MRRFVVTAHEAPITPDFSLSALASDAGRLDVVCRGVADGLLTSHGVREDTSVWVVLQDQLSVRLDGATVRNLSPDERSVAGLIRSALDDADRAVGVQWVDSSPGVAVTNRGFRAALEAASDAGVVLQLHEDGTDFETVDPPAATTFVLSDHRDFTRREQTLLDEYADAQVSLGPTALHVGQAITVVHHWLDRAER
jgi:tRNA (pseudouridine54-N1)-methyltransferase